MSTAAFNPAAVAAPAATAAAGAAAAAGVISTAWIPVIGPAVAAVTLGISAIINRKSGRQKVAATQIVDELEPMMQRNVEAYLEGPRTRTSQAVALKNFDDAWVWLTSSAACGNPELDKAGRACITDRSPGGRWDWFSYYRDPIANDADVRQDTAVEAMLGLDLSSPDAAAKWLVPALLVLIAVSI